MDALLRNSSLPMPEGIWGPVTATLDWCEVNYQFSYYIAEMANTFSNLFSIWIAMHGVIAAQKESLPTRTTIGSVGFTLVGLGSFAFHATLLHGAQLADEIPMILVASYGCFILFDTERGFGTLSRRGLTLASALVIFNILFIWSYVIYRNPVYHQVVFGSLFFITAFRTQVLLRRAEASKQMPPQIRSMISKLFITGFLLFGVGFFIWNLDTIYCTALTRQKVAVGWPLAFLLEGHAWWHIFTASGVQLMLVGITYTTLCIKDDHRNYQLGRAYGVPYIQRVTGKKPV